MINIINNLVDELHEAVYVVDMDTHELYFMNKAARSACNLAQDENVIGRKCYELLMQEKEPCSFCSNKFLQPKQYYEHNAYHKKSNKNYSLRDTMLLINGKRVRLTIAIDSTEKDNQKKTIEYYENNEQLLNKALAFALDTDNPIQKFIEYMGRHLLCERIYVFEEDENGFLDNTYEWCQEGVSSEIENLQKIPKSVAAGWYRAFEKGENIVIHRLEDIKDSDIEMYEILKPQNIESVVVFPIIHHNKILGFFGVDNPNTEHIQYISNILSITGHFIYTMINQRSLVKELEKKSLCDQLTGALNRYALEKKLLEEQEGILDIGVIYCDIMGLKQINDTFGHDKGDLLIQETYQFLKKYSQEYPIFRLGGDEFVVLCKDGNKKRFDSVKMELSEQQKNQNISVAIGAVWGNLKSTIFSDLLQKADQNMYLDKHKRKVLGEYSHLENADC